MTITTPPPAASVLPNARAIDHAIGARLRQLRTLAGLSQEAVANRLGLSFQQLQKYEKGANRVSAGRLAQLAVIYNTSPASIFEAAELPAMPTRAEAKATMRAAAALAEITDARLRNSVVSLIETLAQHQGVEITSITPLTITLPEQVAA